jgi:hypothetical protein
MLRGLGLRFDLVPEWRASMHDDCGADCRRARGGLGGSSLYRAQSLGLVGRQQAGCLWRQFNASRIKLRERGAEACWPLCSCSATLRLRRGLRRNRSRNRTSAVRSSMVARPHRRPRRRIVDPSRRLKRRRHRRGVLRCARRDAAWLVSAPASRMATAIEPTVTASRRLLAPQSK